MSAVEVRRLAVPATADEQTRAGADFRAFIDVRNEVMAEWRGDPDYTLTYTEAHAAWVDAEWDNVFLGGFVDDRLVGAGCSSGVLWTTRTARSSR